MYTYKEEDFGGLRKHTIFDEESGNGFSVVPVKISEMPEAFPS